MIRMFLAAIVGLFLFVGSAAAQIVCSAGLPNTFTSGTTISAAQMNQNFAYITTCFATLGANTFTGAQTLPANPTSALQAATKQYVDAGAGGGGGGSSLRQVATAGPITSAGLPNFLPSTASGLSVTSVNVSSTTPLAATAANNVGSTTGAQNDTLGVSTSNLTWGSLTASTTNFLYVTIAAGAFTTGSTTLVPIYQWGGTPATTSGQFTFNISEMRGYLGNGSSAPQTNIVFVGEAVTGASSVTSTVAYAYNGYYDSGYTTPSPGFGVGVTKAHNIGVLPRRADMRLLCITTDNGYAVGDEINKDVFGSYDGTYIWPIALSSSYKSMTIISASVAGYDLLNKSTGAVGGLNSANWKYRFIADRGW